MEVVACQAMLYWREREVVVGKMECSMYDGPGRVMVNRVVQLLVAGKHMRRRDAVVEDRGRTAVVADGLGRVMTLRMDVV